MLISHINTLSRMHTFWTLTHFSHASFLGVHVILQGADVVTFRNNLNKICGWVHRGWNANIVLEFAAVMYCSPALNFKQSRNLAILALAVIIFNHEMRGENRAVRKSEHSASMWSDLCEKYLQSVCAEYACMNNCCFLSLCTHSTTLNLTNGWTVDACMHNGTLFLDIVKSGVLPVSCVSFVCAPHCFAAREMEVLCYLCPHVSLSFLPKSHRCNSTG